MTPGLTAAPFSEAMPAHPQNGDEVIAVNLGSSVYTLTGSITGGNVALDAGETAILVYAGSTAGWYVTWRSATGAVSYPISVAHGGTGIDGAGLLSWVAANADTDTASTTAFWSATDSGAYTFNVSAGIELPNNVSVAGDWVLRVGGTGASTSGAKQIQAGTSDDSFRTRFSVNGGQIDTGWPVTIGNHPSEGGIPFVGLSSGTGDEPQIRLGGFSNYIDFFPAPSAPRTVNTIAFGVSGFPNWVSIAEAGLFPDSAGSGVLDLGVDDTASMTPIYGRLAWRNGYFDGNVGAASYTCSAMPAAAGASGTIYADPITHALFITP